MMDVKIERPLLPLRDIVVFPNMVVPLFVGRDKSIAALNEVMKKDKKIVLVTQKNSEIDDPKKTDVFMYGCEGNILQLLKLPDGTVKVLVEGSKRVKILDFKDNEKFIICEYAHHHDVVTKDEDLIPLAMTAVRRLEKLTSINKKVSSETINNIKKLTNASHIADNIASHLTATISEKQQIFETIDVKKRLNSIIKIMENETSIIGVEKRIRGRVKTQMEKTQREYYLNEQLKAIQKELGEIEDGKDETSSLNKLIIKAKMPKDVEKKCMAELKKLKNMSPMSAEATVIRNYLDWMTDLPWYKKSQVDIDLKKALAVLDADHFGLEKVKERIIEFLAVQKRMEKIKGPILCLVGPPGVGKTSLGKSIAKATNREFVRMSVGGMRDEAEIRGHRRTYIGSLPGKIIQMMKKAGTKNPLILLDEIGRGTSTYDGISIAWSIVEYLQKSAHRPKTLFATHYHELNDLEGQLKRVHNYHVTHKEVGNKIIFLRKLAKGGSTHSFGIHVAKMAGMPNELVDRANTILHEMELKNKEHQQASPTVQATTEKFQLSIFDAHTETFESIRKELDSIDINNLTPVEALMKLQAIKQKLN